MWWILALGCAQPTETLFVGTGEYAPTTDWHAILRFDDAATLDSWGTGDVYDPDATVNVQTDLLPLHVDLEYNFAHAIYVTADADEMFLATIFSTSDDHRHDYYEAWYGEPDPVHPTQEHPHPCTDAAWADTASCGAIVVLGDPMEIDGETLPRRSIFGDRTRLDQPHGLWIDEDRDVLYVANTFAENILVWDDASVADGNTPPDRVIDGEHLTGARPIHVFVDPAADRLFVVTAPGEAPPQPPAVLIYEGASTVDGDVPAQVRIAGTLDRDSDCTTDPTRLSCGNNQTTHNVVYDADSALLFVAHHTNEVLIYDLAGVDFGQPGDPTRDLPLVPRVIGIHEGAGDTELWSAYGLFYQPTRDALFVAAGHTLPGPYVTEDPADLDDQKHAIKVYEGISDPALAGRVEPDQVIYWSSVDRYFPPQPLWVVDRR